jgi:hypothetical protein
MVLVVFCWAIFSRVPTSILTRDADFLWTNLGQIFLWTKSIISVTTDAILAHCMNSPQPPGEMVNRVAKIIGSAEKSRVVRDNQNHRYFFRPLVKLVTDVGYDLHEKTKEEISQPAPKYNKKIKHRFQFQK